MGVSNIIAVKRSSYWLFQGKYPKMIYHINYKIQYGELFLEKTVQITISMRF